MSILDEMGLPALLEQTAEEATELAHAALKLSRIERKENPTPVSLRYAYDNLKEEVADVLNCISVLAGDEVIDQSEIDEIMEHKFERWYKRLRNQREVKR